MQHRSSTPQMQSPQQQYHPDSRPSSSSGMGHPGQVQGMQRGMTSSSSNLQHYTHTRQAPPPPGPSHAPPHHPSHPHPQSQSQSRRPPSHTPTNPEDRYVRQDRIGKGSFGEVYKGYDTHTSLPVAIKIIDLEAAEDEIEDIQLEIQILGQMESEWVTKYHAAFLKQSHLWIIMEYCSGGSCADLLKSGTFREEYIAILARELLKGLEYLHGENKLHRDIKAANILLTSNGGVKLADFGVSGQLSATMTKKNTFVGTPYWMSPEVIKQSGYSYGADIWSLGITLIEMARGEPPYADLHPMKVLFLIPRNPPPVLDETFSKPFRDFVAQCLQRDPKQRPTAKELLKHRFIKNAKRNQYLTELIDRHEVWKAQGPVQPDKDGARDDRQTYVTLAIKADDKLIEVRSFRARFGPPGDELWDFGTIRNTLHQRNHAMQDPHEPLPTHRDPSMMQPVSHGMRESSSTSSVATVVPHPGPASRNANEQSPAASTGTAQRIRGPLPRPPSLQSMRPGTQSGRQGSTRGRGNEIFETIRHAPVNATQGPGSGHARDRAGHGSELHQERELELDLEGDGDPLDRSPIDSPTFGNAIPPGVPENNYGMDDVILDSVIIPAIDSLSLRVPNNEARQALVNLRLAFEDAERLVPGVCVALVAEICESVEQVDDDAP